jgi:beta-glucosidase
MNSKRRRLVLVALFLACSSCSILGGEGCGSTRWKRASTDERCPGPLPEGSEVPWLAYPRHSHYSYMSLGEWCQRVQSHLSDPVRNKARVVFLGDSITQLWKEVASDVWQEHFGQHSPLLLGIGGDQTQQVLWRIERGELEGLDPAVVVLLIGVNNLIISRASAEDTARGVRAVNAAVRIRLPKARILHLALFPAGETRSDWLRQKIEQTNALLQDLAGLPNVVFLDLGPRFLSPDGGLPPELMDDFLHPTRQGYEVWAHALDPLLAKWIGPPAP